MNRPKRVLGAAALCLFPLLGGCRSGAAPPTETHGAPVASTVPDGTVQLRENTLKLSELQIEPAPVRSLQPRLEVTGTVEPDLSGVMKVSPRAAGKIAALRANVGDTVAAGAVLAIVESTQLAEAQAEYDHTTHRVAFTTRQLDRQRKLARLGVFGAPKVEEARNRAATAQGESDAIRAEVSAARNEVTEARSDTAARQGETAAAEADVASAQSDIAAAEGAVADAEGQVRASQSLLAQAQASVKVAQSRFNRADALLKDQLVSRQDWEQAQADLQRSQSDTEVARAVVSRAQAQVTQDRAKVGAARARLTAAQAKVQAARGRGEQAAARVATVVSRQAEVEAKLAASLKRGEVVRQEVSREERVFRGGYLTSKEVAEAESAHAEALHEQEAAAIKVRLLGGVPGGDHHVPVTAPLGGRVTERLVTAGEMVTTEKSLFTIINLRTVWVQLNVYQKDLPMVRAGEAVTIAGDSAPGRTFSGVVSYVGDVLDEKSRTVRVRCAIDNRGGALKPASFVHATIRGRSSTPAVVVPASAVQELHGKQVVFMPTGRPREFRAQPVEIARKQGPLIEIRSGLRAGERIVTRNAFLVKAEAIKSEFAEE